MTHESITIEAMATKKRSLAVTSLLGVRQISTHVLRTDCSVRRVFTILTETGEHVVTCHMIGDDNMVYFADKELP